MDSDALRRNCQALSAAFQVSFFQHPDFEELFEAFRRIKRGQRGLFGWSEEITGDFADFDAPRDFFGIDADFAGAGDEADNQVIRVSEVEVE